MDGDAANPVLLIQFAREPQEGRVKTRMMPHLSARQACALHCELVLWTSRQLVEADLGDVELAVAGDTTHPLFERCRALGISRYAAQCGADLGERMYTAMRGGLQQYSRVILVGSDCPGIDRTYLVRALRALDSVPVVLGPATDGGYVLIGARQIREALFQGIPWGTGEVYRATTVKLRQLRLDWGELPALADIDRPEDLPLWEAARGS
jgi:rSAM/selenodomain-associated transferase 1